MAARNKRSRLGSASRDVTKPRRKPLRYTAETADKHELYEISVQDPKDEIQRLTRIFKSRTGRRALKLREDFGGTANLCAAWIRSHPDRTATAIDIDQPTLDWGAEHNLAPLGDDAARITMRCQDVRDDVPERFDVAVGFNYSYQIFKTREDLRSYFESVRKSLKRDGMLFLDMMGGWDAQRPMIEERRERKGFFYVWDQHSFNPIDNNLVCKIHFRFKDGTELREAFVYDWRLWTPGETTELLFEAGFERADVYWEDEDEDGDPNGRFRIRRKVDNDPAWNCYIVAQKRDLKKKRR